MDDVLARELLLTEFNWSYSGPYAAEAYLATQSPKYDSAEGTEYVGPPRDYPSEWKPHLQKILQDRMTKDSKLLEAFKVSGLKLVRLAVEVGFEDKLVYNFFGRDRAVLMVSFAEGNNLAISPNNRFIVFHNGKVDDLLPLVDDIKRMSNIPVGDPGFMEYAEKLKRESKYKIQIHRPDVRYH